MEPVSLEAAPKRNYRSQLRPNEDKKMREGIKPLPQLDGLIHMNGPSFLKTETVHIYMCFRGGTSEVF